MVFVVYVVLRLQSSATDQRTSNNQLLSFLLQPIRRTKRIVIGTCQVSRADGTIV